MPNEKENLEVEKDSGAKVESEESKYVPGKPYSKLKREISEEDLKYPAVQRILLAEIDRLEVKLNELEIFQKEFFKVDKEKAILEEKLKINNAVEVLYGFCLAVGSASMGLSSLVWDKGFGWIFVLLGSLLIIGGLASKYILWK